MGDPVELTEEEKNIYKELKELHSGLMEEIMGRKKDNFDERYDQMRDFAHELHMSLKNRGIEVRHHQYMLDNRGVPPEDPEFYDHVHSVEDLLKFIDDVDANTDPVDETIGEEFDFRFYSKRWGHKDTCRVKRTKEGWEFSLLNQRIPSRKDGLPGLERILSHEGVAYPITLPDYFRRLWKSAANGLSKEKIQEALNELAEWVSNTEKSSPKGEVWAAI